MVYLSLLLNSNLNFMPCFCWILIFLDWPSISSNFFLDLNFLESYISRLPFIKSFFLFSDFKFIAFDLLMGFHFNNDIPNFQLFLEHSLP
jgi:hypothetical protein